MIHVHQKTNIASNHVFGGMAGAGALLVRRPQRQLVSLLCPYFNMVEGQSVLQDVAAPPSCPQPGSLCFTGEVPDITGIVRIKEWGRNFRNFR